MKQIISWILQKIVLPLAPFLFGALARYVDTRQFSERIFDGTELSFSMAMLSILILAGIYRLNDRHLRESLETVFILFVVAFVGLFSWQIYIKSSADTVILEVLNELKGSVQTGMIRVENLHLSQIDEASSELDFLRSITFIFSYLIVPVSIIFKMMYRLEE